MTFMKFGSSGHLSKVFALPKLPLFRFSDCVANAQILKYYIYLDRKLRDFLKTEDGV